MVLDRHPLVLRVHPSNGVSEKIAEKLLRSARPAEAAIAKVFAKIRRKKSYFAIFSDALDARGHRELRVVKISASNDPWRYQKRQKNEKKKLNFL